MPEIGLFPLGTALLPTEQVPLHIFEPRYRELIGECVDQGLEFGLVYVGDEGMHAIGTRASVVDVMQRFDDGRLDIVVEGGTRFRLVELTEGRSFHTGLVEDVSDDVDPAAAAEVERSLAALRAPRRDDGGERGPAAGRRRPALVRPRRPLRLLSRPQAGPAAVDVRA